MSVCDDADIQASAGDTHAAVPGVGDVGGGGEAFGDTGEVEDAGTGVAA